MKTLYFSLISLLSIYTINAQVENTKEAIVKNKVKTISKKNCYYSNSSSCSMTTETYDQRGNVIEWDDKKIGTKHQYIYDQKNRKIADLWVTKGDSKEIDTIHYAYNTHDDLILESYSSSPFLKVQSEYDYDQKNRLIKKVKKVLDGGKETKKTIYVFEWTDFDRKKSSHYFHYEFNYKNSTVDSSKTIYKYDSRNNLIKRIHYSHEFNDKNSSIDPSKTIYKYDSRNNLIKSISYSTDPKKVVYASYYKYDNSLRLIEKKEFDKGAIERRNEEYGEARGNIEYFLTKITYDEKGRIKEKYAHFTDQCNVIANHFTFTYYYDKNGLIDHVDAIREGKTHFTICFEYTFY